MHRVSVLCALAVLALTAQEKPSRVSGHVRRTDTQEPVAKAIVTLHPRDEATMPAGPRVVSTGADGAFVLADVGPGLYVIEVQRTGLVSGDLGAEMVTVRAGEDASNIELKLAPAAVISGVVLDQDNEPVQDLRVTALRLKYQRGGRRELSVGQSAITDDQGKFRIYGIGEGLYYLHTMPTAPLKRGPERSLEYGDAWYPEDAFDEYSEPLRVRAGADIRGIRVSVSPEPVFSIMGRVEADAKDLEHMEMECIKSIPFTLMFGRDQDLQADGSFKIDDLQSGEYVLKVESMSDGIVRYSGLAKAQIVDRNVRVNIPIGQAAEVSGMVTEEGTDVPPKGLQVSLYQSESIAIFPSDVGKTGGFDIREVPPGEYHFGLFGSRGEEERYFLKQVRCSGADYTTLPIKLDVGVPVGDCRIQISKEMGVVRGDVLDGEKPLAGMSVVLIPESHELRRIRRYTLRVKTNAQGKFEIPNAIPGKYLLFALPPNEDGREFALSFADRNLGEAQSVEIKAQEAQVVSLKLLAAR
jgi:hypothetical protein